MIIITGAAGFIGSCLVARLNEEKIYHLGLVDDFSSEKKKRNYENKRFLNIIERNEFIDWFDLQHDSIEFVFHLGARTDTTELSTQIFDDLNLNYSKDIWTRCVKYSIPLVYASSAATYGAGEVGYDDNDAIVPQLKPLNPYGISKNEFDKWVLHQAETPPFWCGLKFFNVYGPNEYHKSRMASVIFHGFNQIKENGSLKLFRSHRPDFEDGKQLRDFVYVKDVTEVMLFFFRHQIKSGIYNLGTGKARTFLDLTNATFSAMQLNPSIEWIDMPADIRDKYQYFTEANMKKLTDSGYTKPFYSLEEGVKDYVQQYLSQGKIW
ncbi:MAG: ADP-glyceromanno-heptose 6-epimerase [Chitinophagaceae bacterium]|nr:ADP-glyceromanno-heptose 6-epimerase [Chitinophagaceae bacterium]